MAEIQTIFLNSFNQYKNNHFVSNEDFKVAKAIMTCRTSSLGGHLDKCPSWIIHGHLTILAGNLLCYQKR